MERYTVKTRGDYYCSKTYDDCKKQKSNPKDPLCCCLCEIKKKAYNKLGEYENLEESLEKTYGKCDGLLAMAVKYLAEHKGAMAENPLKSILLTDEDAEKWQRWKESEAAGKLMILPCKPGDTVWDNDFGRPTAYEVTGFSFGNLNDDCFEYETMPLNQIIIYYSNSNGSITGSFAAREIGKTVFLTEPEAQEALERMKNEKIQSQN